MLVLSRKINERIRIGDDVHVTVTSIGRHNVRLAIDAPKTVPVVREELLPSGTASPEPASLQEYAA